METTLTPMARCARIRTKCAEGHLRLLRLGYEQPQRRMETAKSISQTLAASSILTKSPARGGHGRPYGKCQINKIFNRLCESKPASREIDRRIQAKRVPPSAPRICVLNRERQRLRQSSPAARAARLLSGVTSCRQQIASSFLLV